MRRMLAALLAIILLFSLTACGDDGSGKGFRLPLDSEPRQLDPQSATEASSVTVITALFEGLTRLDAQGRVVDGAATYTVSDDGLTYTFTLKESYWSTISVRGEQTDWDEPTRVVAQDFAFGWRRAVSPDNQSGTATAFYGIKNAEAVHKGEKPLSALGVKAVDDDTLTVTPMPCGRSGFGSLKYSRTTRFDSSAMPRIFRCYASDSGRTFSLISSRAHRDLWSLPTRSPRSRPFASAAGRLP